MRRPTVFAISLASILLTFGLVLAFSKSVSAFLQYQKARRPAWSRPARRNALLLGSATVVVAIGAASVLAYGPGINGRIWHEASTGRTEFWGVPITFLECDRRYRESGSTPTALQHFQRAFSTISKSELPLMDSTPFAAPKSRHLLPRLFEMASPEKRAVVASCLRTNAEALRLLHEGSAHERCRFPITVRWLPSTTSPTLLQVVVLLIFSRSKVCKPHTMETQRRQQNQSWRVYTWRKSSAMNQR